LIGALDNNRLLAITERDHLSVSERVLVDTVAVGQDDLTNIFFFNSRISHLWIILVLESFDHLLVSLRAAF
jgi:hypothetical protein